MNRGGARRGPAAASGFPAPFGSWRQPALCRGASSEEEGESPFPPGWKDADRESSPLPRWASQALPQMEEPERPKDRGAEPGR